MEPFRFHVYACDQKKPEGFPSCSARGAAAVIDALRQEIAARNLLDVVQVTTCSSIGLCERGPNFVVYPDGVWYSGVTPADVSEIVGEHFQNARPVERLMNRDAAALKQEITTSRNQMVTARKAREAAGAIPDDLMEMLRGYQPSRVLLTGIELDVFTAVARAGEPATAEKIAAGLGTDPRATGMLLNALVALGVLAKQHGAFANTPVSARFLTAGSPNDARAALRHHLSLWPRWSTLTACVRAGHAVGVADTRAPGDDTTESFIAAMHRNAALRAPLVVKAIGAEGVSRLLDVGGGSGAYSVAFAQANGALYAEVFDRPAVVPIAERHIAEATLTDRVRTRVGDLRTDDFGSGYDLVLLSAICHMLGPDENRDLLRRVFQALAPGGRVAIQDYIMDEDKTAPRTGALFALNMLTGTQRGSTYSQSEYAAWLADEGFTQVRRIPLAGPSDLMVGEVPLCSIQ